MVSTHSHPKVAAFTHITTICRLEVSTHSHPKVAALSRLAISGEHLVSTHSHPKVAARTDQLADFPHLFQHTATRRWLPATLLIVRAIACGFNTQPPEGGCQKIVDTFFARQVSTHSHPKVAACWI